MNADASPYKSPPSVRLSQGVIFSALILSALEAIHLWEVSAEHALQDRRLTMIYGATLIFGVGSLISFILKALGAVSEWGQRGATVERERLWSSWGALPVAVATLSLCLGIVLSLYPTSDLVNYNYSGYFWLIPSGAIAAYVWFLTRNVLYALDQRLGAPWSAMVSAAATILIIIIAYSLLSESIQQKITTWPLLAVILMPVFMLTGIGVSLLTPDRRSIDITINRITLALFTLSIASIADLSENLDRYEEVKENLLEKSRLSSPIIHSLQKLFDEDGDGVAGKLGGADCDDMNPLIYPGAPEIPLNGIDEDCFGGDLLPPPQRVQAPVLTNAKVGTGVERPNIILITIDTLRADHLHYHGYSRKTSPFLDELSRRGLTFKWAFSTGAQTRVSMPAVFTGRFYSEVSRSRGDWAEVYPDNLTLAERLRAAGYRTVGVPAHRYFLPNYGLHQGFEEWNLDVVKRFTPKTSGDPLAEKKSTSYYITGGAVTDEAVKWFERRAQRSTDDQPFFMWLHYFDPHHFYQDHPEIDFRLSRDAASRPIDLYDEEIRYTDDQLRRLFREFERSPLARNTYVMIHSDHGEGFEEHGYKYHGQELYNDQVHVPLMLFGPNLPAQEINTPVSLIDVMPTILELAQVPALPPKPRGDSLLSFAYQANADHHPIMIEMLRDSTHSARVSLVDWPWKIHYSRDYRKYRFFNLRKDPFEMNELRSERSPAFRRVRRRMMRFLSEEMTPLKPHTRRRGEQEAP